MVVVLHYLHFVFWKKPSTYKLYFLIREFREEGIFKSGAKAHSSLRQFLATQVMKNAFHFVLEALFVLKISIFVLTFSSCIKTA